jgi:Flp pilus assembly protein TadB
VHETTESPESSAFELIAQAYRQVPTWLEARRKGSFSREPGAWMLIFTCAIIAVCLVMFAIILYSFTIWSPVLLIGATALIGFCYLLYLRLRKRANEEGSRTLKEWNYRLDVMHQKMVKYLEEL